MHRDQILFVLIWPAFDFLFTPQKTKRRQPADNICSNGYFGNPLRNPLDQMCYWWRITSSANHLEGNVEWIDTLSTRSLHLVQNVPLRLDPSQNIQICFKNTIKEMLLKSSTLVTLLFYVHCSVVKIWALFSKNFIVIGCRVIFIQNKYGCFSAAKFSRIGAVLVGSAPTPGGNVGDKSNGRPFSSSASFSPGVFRISIFFLYKIL